MIIEIICQYPHNLVMGLSAFVGAGIYAINSIYNAKKELGNKFKFELRRVIDTSWQSIVAGSVAGVALGCSWHGLIIAMLTGIGIDKVANKFKIGKTQILNLAQIIANLIGKIDKKK